MSAAAANTEGVRVPLTRERAVHAAVQHADVAGLEGLTMRHVAKALNVAPMALYRHVANREDLIDAMIDVVFGEIPLPLGGAAWKPAMRDRALSLREALVRHRWAIGLMESRMRPGPANLRHHDAVIGKLRSAGFDIAMVAHAYSLLDGYIYGFALTRMNMPFDSEAEMDAMAQHMFEPFPANEYPNLAEFVNTHVLKPGYDYAEEFEYGLEVILDGLEAALGTD
ncbi:TetR/AcrR family transcriptional regulator [Arthrobacter crusticola]|uniref:TetR/AcrR family transcriptional regulator n=1 Tax=Arthrobacter crusticola TaxID=2547960 RepID=A0A4R5U318_9MICC|nr:TetR/AcrR family transcriptional regulator [Arthrobacter crusticola]TDK27992.1 TetR/AcrR family transcriptional regulator [Arthrobacter crusticola]